MCHRDIQPVIVVAFNHLHCILQWDLNLTNFLVYITKFLVSRMISLFTPLIVKYMKKNFDIMKHCYSKQILPVPWPLFVMEVLV